MVTSRSLPVEILVLPSAGPERTGVPVTPISAVEPKAAVPGLPSLESSVVIISASEATALRRLFADLGDGRVALAVPPPQEEETAALLSTPPEIEIAPIAIKFLAIEGLDLED